MDRLITDDPTESAEAIALASDDELLAAWQLTDGQPGHAVADALAAEMEKREIDF